MSLLTTSSVAGLYAPTLDHSLGATGEELRTSIERAVSPPDSDRWAQLVTRMSRAMQKALLEDDLRVDAAAFGRVCDILGALPKGLPLPEIVIESEAEIGLDWQTDRRHVLTLTVDSTQYIGYAALIDHETQHGSVPFTGATPRTILELFERLSLRQNRF